ncbi:MAG TPA: hypothetical protein VME43_27755 [Bryobacteraceae bacterium]|nr:hypothetical protein [Bryobacteraceae bacterium]
MLTLIRKARSRWFRNELLSQGAAATSAALVAVILLLLLGTQILDWRWAAIIPLAALATGVYLVRRRMPTPYAVAQVVDRRLDFADTLSTALFFHENSSKHVSAEVCALQLERANRLAESADVRRAVPYTVPRAVYPLAALVLVASSLFALRYGLTRHLDLKPPLAAILEQSFGFETHPEMARNTRRPLPPQRSDPQDDSVAPPDPQDTPPADQPAEDPENTPEANGQQQNGKDQKKASDDGKSQPGDDADKAEGEDKDQAGDDRSSSDQASNGQQGKGERKQDSNSKQDSNGSGDNSGLLSKMKDAVQNLFSRVKPQQGNGSQQAAQNQNGKQPSKGQQDGKQQASKDGQKNGGQQGDSQDGQSGDQAQESQDPQSKGSGKSDSQQASKQPGSGIGSQDGDKTIKQAEQLAAMGKISEILGKRSATITGEATVEVQSTSQQLRTPYAQRGAQHTQGGAEINRDEVPVGLQTYVERYFDQVRKQPAPAAASPTAPQATPPVKQ